MNSDQLKLLVETVQQLSMARDLETIMSVVRTSARKLTGADGATFVLKDKDLCHYADEDAIGPLWKGQRFPLSACISGWAMINRQAAIVPDIYADSRIPVEAYRPTFVKSLVMVPIRTIDPIGAIGNYWAKLHTPSAEETQLLQSLADITSVSIENIYIYNQLEQRVKERTQQLELANKELEAFSYSVSHDLRAPLRSITNRLGILQEDYAGKTLDAEAQNAIGYIIQKAADMNQLIDSLLDFSRSGKKEFTLVNVHMKTMVEQICNHYLNQEKNRNIVFEIMELPAITGDATLIKQVWENLISNAVKYTGQQEKAEIRIEFTVSSGEIIYSVKDNGQGFDMKYYHKLFGIFQRLHDESEFSGNGIGLALVKRIVERHGGKIWANSEDKGTTFYFSLPENRVQ